MRPRPSVVVLDVNETLSDMAQLAGWFTAVGAPELLARMWFAALLRDGFALAAAGGKQPFARLAEGMLRILLAGVSLNRPADEAVQDIPSGFAELSVHPHVPPGVGILRRHGLRLVTLTNGSADVADWLLTKAGLRGEFECLLSVDDADAWKPPAAYAHAARACSAPMDQMLLVAVHPWDIHGAHQAGMHTGWITRQQARHTPATSPPPTCTLPASRIWPSRSSPDPSPPERARARLIQAADQARPPLLAVCCDSPIW